MMCSLMSTMTWLVSFKLNFNMPIHRQTENFTSEERANFENPGEGFVTIHGPFAGLSGAPMHLRRKHLREMIQLLQEVRDSINEKN